MSKKQKNILLIGVGIMILACACYTTLSSMVWHSASQISIENYKFETQMIIKNSIIVMGIFLILSILELSLYINNHKEILKKVLIVEVILTILFIILVYANISTNIIFFYPIYLVSSIITLLYAYGLHENKKKK